MCKISNLLIYSLYESEWFNTELKAVFGIDVFAYPFDREKGYVIIEERGISILLMTMEKMNELEDVIGKFTGIKKFQLDQKNIGSKKAYRFAYSEYKKIVRFSRELLDQIYFKHFFVKHFYTNDMIETFISRWSDDAGANVLDNRVIIA